jgi:opacity protein-like surface antigen
LSNLDEHEVLGLGLEYRFNKNFAIGVEGSVWLREYDQPPLIQPTPGVVYPPPIDFISEGVLLTVRAIYPASNTEWYVGAGLGRFGTTLTLCEEWVEYYAPVCREGAKEYVQRDRSISYQLLLGVDWFATQHVYGGVQLRQLFLDADFGDITGGKVDLGGTALVVGLGYAF